MSKEMHAMGDENTMNGLISRLRSGYRPTETEAIAWNVADTVHVLRSEITEADLRWIIPPPSRMRRVRSLRFMPRFLQPFATNPEVRHFLAQRFETAGPYLKAQLLWRLLDDAALPSAVQNKLFEFVISDWSFFQNACVAYLGSPSEILQAALGRLADCPTTKRWIYLCCLPQYADDQHAVKGVLTIAVNSTETFTAHVAHTLMDRFFTEIC